MQKVFRLQQTATAESLTGPDIVERARLARQRPSTVQRGRALTIRGLRKSFGEHEVLRGIDVHIPAGQFVAIVGRSGCGKSTLLRLIAGLERADAGTISFGGEMLANDIRVMFQEPRLLPWARVLSNVEVGLGRERHLADAQARAERALVEVGLDSKRDQWPADRSNVSRWRGPL
jgi:sulfonate transport system ATP-binding protein